MSGSQAETSRATRARREFAALGFVLTVLVLVVGGVLGFINTLRLAADRNRVLQTHQVIESVESLLSLVKDAETGQRGYLLTADEDYLRPYDEATRAVGPALTRLETLLAHDTGQQGRIVVLQKKIEKRLDELQQTVVLMKRGDQAAVMKIVRSDVGKVLMDEVRAEAAAIEAEEREQLRLRTEAVETSYATVIWSVLAPAVLGSVLVAFLAVLTRRNQRLRQRAVEAAAEHREELRVMLTSIGDGVIATDASGRVTFINRVAQGLTGWGEADAAGKALEEVFRIVNEDTRKSVDNPALRALKEGSIVGLANHTILIAADGTERAIDDSAAPIRDAKGKVVGAVLVFRDVGEQRRDARRLAESEARKAAILDAALDCIITCDHEGKVLEFNPAAERTFGYRREEVLGREMSDLLVPPALRQRHQEGMARVVSTGKGRILGKRVVMAGLRADGSEFPIEFAVTEIRTSGPPLFTAHLRDITDRKRAEAAAAERLRHAALDAEVGLALTSSDTMRDMLQACAASLVRNLDAAFARVWTLDPSGAFLELQASAGLYTHTDGPHGRVPVGQYKIGLIARERKPHLTNAVLGDPRVPEQEWARREGLVAFAGYPLVVGERLVGVVAMFARRPLSEGTLGALAAAARAIALGIERKGMEERLRQLVADLSEADRRKDEFLATLAHELRNPLAPIRNGLQLMRLAGGQAATAEQARSMMERQLAQLVRLVDDLMDVSRITRGKLELRKERVDLADVVSSAVETSRPLLEETGQHLTVELPRHPVPVDADLTRLAQVFSNLLNNAAKYTEPGGSIKLSARRRGSEVMVAVRDTGIGIAPEQLPRIFAMFAQVDRSLEKSRGGLGIGLTLVKRLTEMHGGTVEARSEGLGKGSEFIVRLPVAAGAPEPEPEDPEPEQLGSGNNHLRILIVDDNRDGADSLALMLRMLGNDVRTAYDGLQGLEEAAAFRPEVILLDIGLPKLNGYEACRRLREQPWGRAAVLIAVTGWGQEEDRRRSRDSGFDHHLVKPVDPQALTKLLAGLRPSVEPGRPFTEKPDPSGG